MASAQGYPASHPPREQLELERGHPSLEASRVKPYECSNARCAVLAALGARETIFLTRIDVASRFVLGVFWYA